MAPSNMKQDHHLYRFRCRYFIYSLMYLLGHLTTIGFLSGFDFCTDLFDFLILVPDLQITSLLPIYL